MRFIFQTRDGVVRSGWTIFVAVAMTVVVLPVLLNLLFRPVFAAAPGVKDFFVRSGYLSMFVLYTLFIPATIGLWKLFYRKGLSRMGLSPKHWPYQLGYGLVFGVNSFCLVYLVLLLTRSLRFGGVDTSVLGTWAFIGSFLNFVYVGVYEEILFRGFMMSALQTTRNKWAVIMVPSMILCILHVNDTGVSALSMINLFLFGLLYAYQFLKTGRLWMSIGYHIMWNFCQASVFGFMVGGGQAASLVRMGGEAQGNLLNGGIYGPVGGLVVTVVLLLGLVWVYFFVKQSEEEDVFRLQGF